MGNRYAMRLDDRTRRNRTKLAARSLAAYERALALSSNTITRLGILVPAATSAFEAGDLTKAEAFGRELLERSDLGFPVGIDGSAIHYGNIVLGRIALHNGDTEAAEKRLLDAGRTPGSPNLGSFGPNMRLARDLIAKGSTKTVLEYFVLCKRFWNRPELAGWAAVVRAGKIPDFGPNLMY